MSVKDSIKDINSLSKSELVGAKYATGNQRTKCEIPKLTNLYYVIELTLF